MTRGACLLCAVKVNSSSLTTIVICRKCFTQLKLNVWLQLNSGTARESIRGRMGLSENLFREILQRLGIYDALWISTNAANLADLAGLELPGVSQAYNHPEKNRDRDYMVEAAIRQLQDRPVAMLTLPHVAMTCYLQAAKYLNICPERSTFVERDTFLFNIISSWVTNHQAFSDGQVLSGVRLFHGTMRESLVRLPLVYNFVNMDFLGPWTVEVERTVRALFARGRLEADSFVSITLSEARRWIENPQYALVEDFHKNFVIEKFKKLAKDTLYSPIYLWHHTYKAETRYPMITITFKVRKKAS